MLIKELGTVFMRVDDLDAALPFYTEVLGLTLREVEQWEDGRGANYLLPNSSILLTLIEQKEGFEPLKHPMFNLYCPGIDAAYEELRKKNIKISSLNKWSSEWNDHLDFDVFDPAGNPINLIERTPRK